MKGRASLVFCCSAFLLMCCLAISPRAFAQQSVPEIPFDSAPDLLKLPNDLYFGEASGVAVNSQGHILVFSRGNTTGPAYGEAAAQLFLNEHSFNVVDALGEIARAHDRTVARVALAWVRAQPGVSSTITGARRVRWSRGRAESTMSQFVGHDPPVLHAESDVESFQSAETGPMRPGIGPSTSEGLPVPISGTFSNTTSTLTCGSTYPVFNGRGGVCPETISGTAKLDLSFAPWF